MSRNAQLLRLALFCLNLICWCLTVGIPPLQAAHSREAERTRLLEEHRPARATGDPQDLETMRKPGPAELSVKKVFEKDLGSPVGWLLKGGLLDTVSGPTYISPDGERIFVSDMLVNHGRPRLTWLEWRKSRSVSKVHKDVSCRTPEMPHMGAIFTDLTFLPEHNELLAIACHRLYLLDSSTLDVKRVLLAGQVMGPIAVAVNNSWVLVQRLGEDKITDAVVSLSTSTWTEEERWDLPEKLAGLGITGDGGSAVLLLHGSGDAGSDCVLWIRDFPFFTSLARKLPTNHPCGPVFHRRVLSAVNNDPDLIVDPAPLLRIWNIRKQMLVREQEIQVPDLDEKEINDFALRVSPDASYVTLVVNSNLFFQVLVTETVSGKILFASERSGYSQAFRGIGMVRTLAREGVSSDISADGRLILSARGRRVTVFEVSK